MKAFRSRKASQSLGHVPWLPVLCDERQETRSHCRASFEEEQDLGQVTWDPAQLQEAGLVTPQEGGVCFFLL